jgi:hypothetical protein
MSTLVQFSATGALEPRRRESAQFVSSVRLLMQNENSIAAIVLDTTWKLSVRILVGSKGVGFGR